LPPIPARQALGSRQDSAEYAGLSDRRSRIGFGDSDVWVRRHDDGGMFEE
jgi:hypothetical protein